MGKSHANLRSDDNGKIDSSENTWRTILFPLFRHFADFKLVRFASGGVFRQVFAQNLFRISNLCSVKTSLLEERDRRIIAENQYSRSCVLRRVRGQPFDPFGCTTDYLLESSRSPHLHLFFQRGFIGLLYQCFPFVIDTTNKIRDNFF